MEEFWGYWCRYIWINRYAPIPSCLYTQLFELVKDKDYFVLMTNVDHCFRKAGYDKQRLFCTQGDYGLLQCSKSCHNKTYDNEETIVKMVLAQGYRIDEDSTLLPPENGNPKMTVPSDLIPYCPVCGEPMSMNLRAEDTFVQDEGWYTASERYSEFLRRHKNIKTLFLDAGCGFNTPTIFKVPYWQMTEEWPDATYVCLNYGQAFAPDEAEQYSFYDIPKRLITGDEFQDISTESKLLYGLMPDRLQLFIRNQM